jgi:hypothetical protein
VGGQVDELLGTRELPSRRVHGRKCTDHPPRRTP